MPKGKKKLIVLVEDEQTLANLIELHLKKKGFSVKTAKDGIEGLEMIMEEKPDLVLLDIILPRMNGFSVMEKLNEQGILPALPVIIVSASGQPVEIERARKFGARDYLIKVNFHPDEVVEKVQRALGEETLPDKPKTKKKQGPSEEKPSLIIPQNQETPGGNSVLVVEDDTLLVNALERKFSNKNYKVFKAMRVDDARSILEKEDIDIVLLDIVLPDTNGLAFLKELKESKKWGRIPVIIISNLGQRDEIKEGIKMGAEDYIVKAETVPNEIFLRVDAMIQEKNTKSK